MSAVAVLIGQGAAIVPAGEGFLVFEQGASSAMRISKTWLGLAPSARNSRGLSLVLFRAAACSISRSGALAVEVRSAGRARRLRHTSSANRPPTLPAA